MKTIAIEIWAILTIYVGYICGLGPLLNWLSERRQEPESTPTISVRRFCSQSPPDGQERAFMSDAGQLQPAFTYTLFSKTYEVRSEEDYLVYLNRLRNPLNKGQIVVN